jgi:hypothetical protein
MNCLRPSLISQLAPRSVVVIVSRSAITCKMVERPPHPRTLVNSSKK